MDHSADRRRAVHRPQPRRRRDAGHAGGRRRVPGRRRRRPLSGHQRRAAGLELEELGRRAGRRRAQDPARGRHRSRSADRSHPAAQSHRLERDRPLRARVLRPRPRRRTRRPGSISTRPGTASTAGPASTCPTTSATASPGARGSIRTCRSGSGIVARVNAGRATGAPAMRLVPVGQALARLDDAIRRGDAAGLTDIRALFRDDIHLNDLGAYFSAMVQYATLYGRDPRGLPRAAPRRLGRRLRRAVAGARRAPAGDRLGGRARRPALRRPGGRGRRRACGIGLAGISDWSTEAPFIDLMKSARPWVGHLPGQWGGWDQAALAAAGDLDAQGWPRRLPDDADRGSRRWS